MSSTLKIRFVSATAVACGLAVFAQAAVQETEAALVARAKAIHERVITLDTHDDISPNNFRPDVQLHDAAHHAGEPAEDERGRARRVVHDRLRRPGAADARGLSTTRTSRSSTKFDAVHRLTKEIAPNQIGLALTPADVAEDRRVAAGRSR